MASSKEYLSYVLDLLRLTSNVSYKRMMGEFILYKDNTIFGGVYDNRFLIKKSESTKKLNFIEVFPYTGGSKMLMVDIENPEEIKNIVDNFVIDLKNKKL